MLLRLVVVVIGVVLSLMGYGFRVGISVRFTFVVFGFGVNIGFTCWLI